MKEFSKFQIASFKRTAQNVYPLVRKKEKLVEQINAAQAELTDIEAQIDAQQGYIKEATGGYTTEDIIIREVTDTGKKDKNGNPVKVTTFKLRYPETVIPPVEEGESVQAPEEEGILITPVAPEEEIVPEESNNIINYNQPWQQEKQKNQLNPLRLKGTSEQVQCLSRE